jgi:hypothetical protein
MLCCCWTARTWAVSVISLSLNRPLREYEIEMFVTELISTWQYESQRIYTSYRKLFNYNPTAVAPTTVLTCMH